jgi:predicted ATP-grasp superfamily ATP-dependent carboligase
MSLFVTDGEQRPTLAVVRALGRAGIPVTVGAEQPTCLAGRSRYCSRTVRYPSPLKEPESFQAFVQQEVLGGRYRVLLPMTDVTVQLLSSMRESFAPHVCLPMPCKEKVQLVQDKQQVLALAERMGIVCPKTFVLHEQESFEDLARRVPYPVVIKSRISRFCRNGRWTFGSVQYAHGASDLIKKYREAQAQIPNPLIQEKIEGEGQGVFLLMWDGELKAAFCHRRLREKPPWGGISVYCESIPLNNELVGKSVSLLKAIGWQGVAMVEYKVDRRDGRPKLMEVNGRFWGSLQLSIDAGMNFPLLLYRLATGEKTPAQFDYKIGVRSRWLLGDLDHLWIRLAHSNALNGLPSDAPSRLRACVDFLKFYERGMHYEVWRLDDPGPGWFECKSYISQTLRGVFQRQEAKDAH